MRRSRSGLAGVLLRGFVLCALPAVGWDQSTFAGVNAWTQANLVGTAVPELRYSPDGRLWAGTSGSGLHRSDDDAQTWTKTSVPNVAVGGIDRGTVNTDLIYATGYEKLWRSLDGGTSWAPALVQLEAEAIHCISVACGNCTIAFAGTQTGVWKTSDSGTTFAHKTDGIGSLTVTSLATHPSNTSRLVVGTERGPYLSTDGGDFFALKTAGISGIPHIFVTSVAYAGGDGSHVYLGSWYGLFESVDGGESWSRVAAVPSDGYVFDVGVEVGGADPDVWVATDKGLYQNDGTSWARKLDGEFLAVAALQDGSGEGATHKVVASDRMGVLSYSENAGVSWVGRPRVGRPDVVSVAVSPIQPATVFVVVADRLSYFRQVLKTIDGGVTWATVTTPGDFLPSYVAMDAAGAVFLAASAPGMTQGLFRSTDLGATWSEQPDTSGSKPFTCSRISSDGVSLAAILNTPASSSFVNDVYHLAGGAGNWTGVSPSVSGATVRSLDVDVRGNQEIWCGGYEVHAANTLVGRVLRTADAGGTWAVKPQHFASAVTTIHAERGGQKVFAGTQSHGLWVSADNGTTWALSANGLTSTSIRRMAGAAGGIVWVTTGDQGVFRTVSGGVQWAAVAGLPAGSRCEGVACNAAGKTAYVSVLGDGLWTYQFNP